MIDRMNTHYSMTNPASVFDEEAMTALELAGRTTGKVNECVDTINRHLEDCEASHAEHMESVTAKMANHVESVESKMYEQDQVIENARKYMVDNLEETCGTLFDQAVEGGLIDSINREQYAELTETRDKLTTGTYNVRLFGAVGDGVCDDTQAIQAAIDQANAVTGSTVYLPAGHYRVTAPLVIYSHTRLIGAGKRGMSAKGYSGTHITGDNVNSVIITDPTADNVYGAELRDFRVSCTGELATVCIAINLSRASEFYLHNVTVNGGAHVGIRFQGTISHLDNLYLCGNNVGLQLFNTHAVTVSNLNAWLNTSMAVEISGSCYNTNIRDSWIENTMKGIVFDRVEGSLLCYNTTINNTSYTTSSDYSGARFIYAGDFSGDVNEDASFCVQGLNVSDCVVKIADTATAILLHSRDYAIRANIENCLFLTNGAYQSAVTNDGKFNMVTLVNNTCTNYSGTTYPIVMNELTPDTGNNFRVNTKSSCVEIESTYPIKLLPPTGSIQNYSEGQLYYKGGSLRITDGTKSHIIPIQADNVNNSTATTVEELVSNFNGLLDALRNANILP